MKTEINTVYPNSFEARAMSALELDRNAEKYYSVEIQGRNQDGELLVDTLNPDGRHVRRYIIGPRGRIETL